MPLEEPVFRPPAEADSVIIQLAHGCPHNRCLLCGMYKGVRYRVEPWAAIAAQIDDAAAGWPDAMRFFLADGDAMALPFELLERTLLALREAFPFFARASLYANGSSMAAKSDAELAALKALGLSTLYMGMESGDDEILRLVKKGESSGGMLEGVRKAKSQGLKVSVMVLLGIGGRARSASHVERSAALLDEMNPDLLSFLKMVRLPGLPMYEGFVEQSERGAVSEMREIVARLDLDACVVRANHSSIPWPIGGRLPKGKDKLLRELDQSLNSGILDADGPGRIPSAL